MKYAKANPGKLSYSSAGIGTLPHITMELLLRQAGAQVTHVAYKGAAPALTDLLAGVVQLKYDTYATTSPLLPSGKVKVLATAGRARLPQLPNVATVAESGFPGYEGYLWIGVLAPRGTPAQAVSTLASALAKAARSPKVAARWQRSVPAGGSGNSAGSSRASSRSGHAWCATRRSRSRIELTGPPYPGCVIVHRRG